MNDNRNRLLDIQEVADYLGLKKETVYAWVHCRKIPYYKIGRLVKFKTSEIDQWIDSKRIQEIEMQD